MDITRPTGLPGVLDALDADPSATLLAGGTDLMVEVTYGSRRPESVVALKRVEELTHWDGGWIGSGVTWTRLQHGPIRGLAQAARTVGSPQIRNAGTIGGNLGTASPAGDGLPFLAAVDACIVVESRAAGRRTLRWDEFITGPKRNALQPGEVIVAVQLPEHLPEHQEFAKVGARNAMVIAIASACLVRDTEGATRIALGSVGPTPIRARRAEEMISAELRPSPAAVAEFARLVGEEVSPITDHRSTEGYRRHASGVLARRLLERCL
ncbi:MAG: FAD binding domain-containing protein [Acidimicrobiia bacterium]|nr:FAD binding domain-containing protein [Acidimicrobiia bacterium]